MTILVICCYTPSLIGFRMDMLKEFVHSGHKVIAAGNERSRDWEPILEKYGIIYHQIEVSRNGINPFTDWKTFLQIKKLIVACKPDKIFAYNAKAVIYGCLAAKLIGKTGIYALIAGLGSIFRGKGIKNACIRQIMSMQYKFALKNISAVIFQNTDDSGDFVRQGIVKQEQVRIVNGSGVNCEHYKITPLPATVCFVMVARLLKDKGIIEYLNACRVLKKSYPHIRCMLVGPYDSNPSAIKPDELQPYIDDSSIEYMGSQKDVRPYISQSSVFVLPSYHEGTPRSVLEAMAMGRPILTTDAPGCRETVQPGLNGFLVPVADYQALAEKMEYFVNHPEIIPAMGKQSRLLAETKYDVDKVNHAIMEIMNLTR